MATINASFSTVKQHSVNTVLGRPAQRVTHTLSSKSTRTTTSLFRGVPTKYSARLHSPLVLASATATSPSPAPPTGQVRNVTTKDAGQLVKDGWVLLDVRPRVEIDKAQLSDAVEIALFEVEDEQSVSNFIKQATNFGMGGWWMGGYHMKPNLNFLNEVQAKIPKDAKGVVVVCQKGLRSLTACEYLAKSGYSNLAWVNGGLDTARPGDLATVGGKDIRYGGIGGLSELIGWTEVQQEVEGKNEWLKKNGSKLALVLLVLDLIYIAVDGEIPRLIMRFYTR